MTNGDNNSNPIIQGKTNPHQNPTASANVLSWSLFSLFNNLILKLLLNKWVNIPQLVNQSWNLLLISKMNYLVGWIRDYRLQQKKVNQIIYTRSHNDFVIDSTDLLTVVKALIDMQEQIRLLKRR